MTECSRVRGRLSAARDGEPVTDGWVRQHLDGCHACQDWVARLDRVTARLRVDAVDTPDMLPVALAAWDARAAGGTAMAGRRALLAIAGAACLGVAAVHVAGASPITASDAHSSRELAALDAALGAGFLLAAWRPRTFVAGLAPLAGLLALLLVLVATVDVAMGHATVQAEFFHLPAVVGAFALLGLWRRAAAAERPGDRTRGAPRGEVPA